MEAIGPLRQHCSGIKSSWDNSWINYCFLQRRGRLHYNTESAKLCESLLSEKQECNRFLPSMTVAWHKDSRGSASCLCGLTSADLQSYSQGAGGEDHSIDVFLPPLLLVVSQSDLILKSYQMISQAVTVDELVLLCSCHVRNRLFIIDTNMISILERWKQD